MSFIQGFAEGLEKGILRNRERAQDREDMAFKYQMDNLMKDKDKRIKKQEEERIRAGQAKDLSSQLGDANASSLFYKELYNGVSYETLQERVKNGDYQKNPDYTAPEQEVRIPKGVQPQKSPAIEENPVPVKGGIMQSIFPSKEQKAAQMQTKVNTRIDEIDPTLRKESQAQAEDTAGSITLSENNSPYVFKKSDTYKVGTEAQALYDLERAQESGDPAKIADANLKVKVFQRIRSDEAEAKARAEGKNVGRYFSIRDGKLQEGFAGEVKTDQDGNRTVWNISTGQQVLGNIIEMSDDQKKRYYDLTDKYQKKSDELNVAGNSFVSGLQTVAQMDKLIQGDKRVVTSTASLAVLARNLKGEAQAAANTLSLLQSDIDQKLAEGDMEGVSALVKKFEQESADFSNKFDSGDVLGDLAVKKTLFESLKVRAAYQFAMASGLNGKLSNQDFENNTKAIGSAGDERSIRATLRDMTKGSFIKYTSQEYDLNNDTAINRFEQELGGVNLGLKPERLGDKIARLPIGPDDKELMKTYMNGIHREKDSGERQTQDSLNRINPQVQSTARPKQGMQNKQPVQPPAGAIEFLKKNNTPEMRELFKQKYKIDPSTILGE